MNCSEKQEYIQRIMAMEESVQHVVMTAIQEVILYSQTTVAQKFLGTWKFVLDMGS